LTLLRDNDRLKTYREKRDFSRTSEPAPKAKRKAGRKLGYLIQKHAARRLHFDFRLEHDGAFLSWAVPKGPSYDTADKRLAVRTEDHPIEYGKFEGTIPEGEYGAGTVMLWDRGTWQPEGDVDEGLAKGKLAFELFGERLKGKWALVRLRASKRDKGKENWLLIKERDELARAEKRPVVERELRSVKTGRTMEEIARGRKVWRSNRAQEKKQTSEKRREIRNAPKNESEKEKGRIRRPRPPAVFIAPQLATLVDAPPQGKEWLHEIKYDGYRAIAAVGGGNAKIYTRKGLDWTDRFEPLVEPLVNWIASPRCSTAKSPSRTGTGTPISARSRLRLKEERGGFGYYAFDLLHLDGADLRKRPLVERKQLLQGLAGGCPQAGTAALFRSHRGRGRTRFRPCLRPET
jgi:bifunctional non-homologous end joining protein LigD